MISTRTSSAVGGLERIRATVAEWEATGQVSTFAGERIGAPIARPHQILCIGLNYRDHATGTPPVVGMGFSPQVWLQPGDVMELGIDGLGTQRQRVIAPR